MKRLFVLSAFILLFTGLSYADGNKLLHECRGAEIARPTSDEINDYNYCLGYVLGTVDTIQDNQNTTVIGQKPNKKFICLPDPMSGEQLVLVVSKYLHKNPEKLHWSAPALINNALVEAFPCK